MFLSGAVTTVTWNNLNMHRFSTTWLGLGVLVAFACGAPAELEDNLFPGEYTGDETGTAGGQLMGVGNTPAASPPASNVAPSNVAPSTPPANDVPAANTGSTNAPPANDGGGQASPPPASETPPADGSASPPPAAAAGGGAGGCPDDITVLFNRPAEQGGCGGGACHVPGATAPDLVSPNPELRLVDVTSQCNQRPYIGAGDSFLGEKIAGVPECGLAMPFFMPQALSADDEACILAWIDEVSGG